MNDYRISTQKFTDKETLIIFSTMLIGILLMVFGNVFGAILLLAPGAIGSIIICRRSDETGE